ncbi:MAG TPA: hypothetical protein VM165_05355 [Planctomycetaceae bacterium]|nr:hypothetical protein [Planctomycetaceae bacterium]
MTNVLPLHLHTDDPNDLPRALPLDLTVRDPDVIAELSALPAGEIRDDFALKAIRIGVLALRQARGQIDTEVIRREGDRLLTSMQNQLKTHAELVQDRTTTTLREYFDPQSGRFQERVNRLIQRDGELEQMLRRQLGAEGSELAKTLSLHFGQDSELLQWLNPDETRGLLGALRETLGEQLTLQRDHVLKQFSLDNKDGALSRLILELTDNQGKLTEQLQGQIDVVVKEFSLDEENSALSRLVANVERAQRTITREFSLDEDASALSKLKRMLEQTNSAIEGHLSLDEENSALARLKRELLGLLTEHRDQNVKFQEEVKIALQTMIARKQEAAKSTRHGLDFEAAVIDFVLGECQKSGDVMESTGSRVGRIKNYKKGDAVIELGPESVAPGAKVVVEAKEVIGYQLADARLEIDEARQNRDATTGLFVFSRRTAPTGLEPVARLGCDVYVVWDIDDPDTELYLKLGISLARALAVRQHLHDASQTADVQAIETAVLGLEKAAAGFDELQTSAQQVSNHGEKMLKRIDLIRKELERQLAVLKEKTQALKQPG